MREQVFIKQGIRVWTLTNMAVVIAIMAMFLSWDIQWGTMTHQLGTMVHASKEFQLMSNTQNLLMFSIIYQAGAIFTYTIIKTEERWD